MKFTKEQQRAAYKKLPEDVRDFIFSNEVNDLLDEIKKEIGLTEEQSIVADAEILYALIGLQTPDSSIDEIAKALNKQKQELSKLSQKLQTNIFDKVKTMGVDLGEFVSSNNQDLVLQNTKNETLVKAIDLESLPSTKTTELEVPPANLPMVEPEEIVHDTKLEEKKSNNEPKIVNIAPQLQVQTPVPLTTTTIPQTKTSSGYNGKDPYREPIE